MSELSPRRVKAGQALYTRVFLSVYDQLALGLNCRFTWHCPSDKVLELYNRHVSANHMDVGVGTGYFLDNCRFPGANPRVVLVDLNPNSISVARTRLSRYSPEVYRRNVLEPMDIDTPAFDSIGLSHVLHCLPGTMETKVIAFGHLEALLNPGGILFGTTLLYRGVKRSPLATCVFWWLNLAGIMTNRQDDAEGLKHGLDQHFAESHIEIVGCEALFWARKQGGAT